MRQLEALVVRSEAVVNYRPLISPGSNAAILRPIDFLLPAGTKSLEPPSTEHYPDDPEWVPQDRLEQRLQRLKGLQEKNLDKFWTIWKTAYLQSIATNEHQASNTKTQRTTPRIGETVLIHDDTQPRSNWKYGTVKSCQPDRDGVHRVATIALPDGKELQRALPHLYPLEIRPPPKQETDEASDTEDDVQPASAHTSSGTAQTGQPAPLVPSTEPASPPDDVSARPQRAARRSAKNNIKQWAALLLTIVTLSGCISIAQGQSPFVCAHGGKTVIWTPPPIIPDCQEITNKKMIPATAKLFEHNRATFTTKATRCRIHHDRFELWTDPNGRQRSEARRIAPETPITTTECRQMEAQGTCRYGSLQQRGSIWKTAEELSNDEFPGRFYSLFSAKIIETKNCILDHLNVYATHRNVTPFATDAELKDCSYGNGKCRISDQEILVWEPNPHQADEFRFIEEIEGVTDNNSSFNDFKNSRRFTFQNKTVLINGKEALLTNQGFAIIITSRHQRGIGEERAAREQYTEFRDYQRSARMASHFCELTKKLAKIVRSMSDENPVPLLKIAFNTSAVKVRKLADALFEVQICTELPDVKFVPTSECREWPPVVSAHLPNHTQWVIKPGTLEIVEKPQHINNCASNKTMHWNGSFVELDHQTGLLRPFKVQQQAPLLIKILDDEAIIKNWELASSDVTMRQIIADMHKAAEVQRQLGPIRRSSNPQKIEDEVEEFLIPWWVWRTLDATWRFMVTLVVAINIIQFIRWARMVSAPQVKEPDIAQKPRRESPPQRRTPDGRPLDFWGSPCNV
ncbi:unnamed protein product [Bursaphelenchus xylophilus]|uniref:(pine wood nematode) hypothetical protein n=1 Tax=Bursaphelenchus xylophilus TaxID=6326 RepID=A0A1I7SLA8_BURXY|nr:unnamed protein product [Bursaphelenchus xylophilus]CAG9129452.1 unnamed protein product [Bursaphelenchus xylophilus]